MFRDLFGNEIAQEQPKTLEQEYKEYLSSAQWKAIRKAKFDEIGNCCEKCGISKWSAKLEVHHRHYETFKHEKLSDLELLCPECHKEADVERQSMDDLEVIAKKQQSPLYTGFVTWLRRGNPVKTADEMFRQKVDFLTMIYNNSRKSYKLDLRVFGYRDSNPNYSPGKKT